MSKQDVIDGWTRAREQMDPDALMFGREAFDAILAGHTLTVATVQTRLGWEAERTQRAIGDLLDAGLLTLDSHMESITGALGLSTEPSRHRLELEGRQLYTWCALDAIGIPAALNANAEVRSSLNSDGTPIAVTFREGRVTAAPRDIRIVLPALDLDASMVDGVCLEIVFERVESAPRHERIAVLTIEEAMALGRVIWARPRTLPDLSEELSTHWKGERQFQRC